MKSHVVAVAAETTRAAVPTLAATVGILAVGLLVSVVALAAGRRRASLEEAVRGEWTG